MPSPLPSSQSHPAASARRTVRAVVFLATALVAASGCTTEPVAPPPADTTKYTLENTDHFVLLEHAAQHALSCTGLMEVPLADGRLQVVANLKNRESQPLTVQVTCAFRDAGLATLEETPAQTVTLPANTTVAVRFIASSAAAKRYTVRVRDAR